MRRDRVSIVDWMGTPARALRFPEEVGGRCHWYKAMEGEPWDLISYRYWGRHDKWYVIADVNGVLDPFVLPASGERLAIPI